MVAFSFNELAVDILRTLLPSCSKDTVNKHVTLLPLLVERLKASEDQNSISDLSECVICLSAVGFFAIFSFHNLRGNFNRNSIVL